MASKKRGEYYYTLILLESPRTKDHAELRWCVEVMMGVGYTKGRGKSGGVAAIEGKKRLQAATERRDKKRY